MNENWQSWLVFLLVVAAAIYSAWYVLPVSVRQRLRWLHPKLTQSPSCNACSQCGKCGVTVPKPPTDPASADSKPVVVVRKL
jgi:hypothetical protein